MSDGSSAGARREKIDDFSAFGIQAFTTTRDAGSFNALAHEPASDVIHRWYALREELSGAAPRLVTARQVHGARVIVHGTGWEGWLRADAADGHLAVERGTAMAVTVADCVPIFLAHPSGATALLHSGWRGTVGRILEHGVDALSRRGHPAHELHVHFGPAICGRCYEVSPEVYEQLTGHATSERKTVDLRGVLASQARGLGIRHLSTSSYCTRCDNDRFFSHRAGDEGRQLGVIVAEM